MMKKILTFALIGFLVIIVARRGVRAFLLESPSDFLIALGFLLGTIGIICNLQYYFKPISKVSEINDLSGSNLEIIGGLLVFLGFIMVGLGYLI